MVQTTLKKRFKVTLAFSFFALSLAIYATNCGSGSPDGGSSGTSSTAGAGSPGPVANPVVTPPQITLLAVGAAHACAAIDSRIQCWGRNNYGQLGDGTTTDSHHGVWVSGVQGTITGLALGPSYSCALVDGAVWCWGGASFPVNYPVPTIVPGLEDTQGVVALQGGEASLCVIRSGGVQCKGENSSRELGRADTSLTNLDWVTGLGAASGVTKISGAGNTYCAQTATDFVCWGYNYNGQTGRGAVSSYAVTDATPTAVTGLAGIPTNWVSGKNGTCADLSGNTYCWGKAEGNIFGNLVPTGPNASIQAATSSTTLVGPGTLISGYENTCRLSGGILSCVGRADYMLADGVTSSSHGTQIYTASLTALTALGSDVTAAAFNQTNSYGGIFACAIKASTSVVCWGQANANGQLGNDTTTPSAVPVTVVLSQ